MENNMITIKRSEYLKLLERSLKLAALEANGVDNWEGYSNAMSWLEEEVEDSSS